MVEVELRKHGRAVFSASYRGLRDPGELGNQGTLGIDSISWPGRSPGPRTWRRGAPGRLGDAAVTRAMRR
jgi:hypothetical protein